MQEVGTGRFSEKGTLPEVGFHAGSRAGGRVKRAKGSNEPVLTLVPDDGGCPPCGNSVRLPMSPKPQVASSRS